MAYSAAAGETAGCHEPGSMSKRRFSGLLARDAESAARLVLIAATLALAVVTTRSILAKTGGEPGAPLDDTFIHFQYARSFAELHPLAYTPGEGPTPGATSLLWPMVLAPFWALGARGVALLWVAWALGWTALGATAIDTWRLAEGLVSRAVAFAAGAMVLAFGGLVWSAGSGMEIVPFAWIIVRTARRAAEWWEGGPVPRWELVVLGVLAPCLRPEGLIASATAGAALALAPRGRARAWALAPLVAPAVPGLVNLALTGSSTSTTALVKWLPASPYLSDGRLFQAVLSNLQLLFGTLLDGRVWSAVFIPSGGRILAWAALPALVAVGIGARRPWRMAVALVLALGILIPTTYDSFLWNRLRYLWPFAPGWFVALAALCEGLGSLAARIAAELRGARTLAAGALIGAFASHLSWSIDDLSTSADAIRRQQVALGRWARDALPADAIIGVNDTGAIAYFSERRVFDVVGLTTPGEARYWVAGAGSRFEHYEHLARQERPTHFIVYPGWMAAEVLLGTFLTERSVPGATILGGTTMVAHVASWDALSSGTQPLRTSYEGTPIDRLDVADLESEADHDYLLGWANQADNQVFDTVIGERVRADGGRAARVEDHFLLKLEPRGHLVMRGRSEGPLEVSIDGRALGSLELSDEDFAEGSLTLPADVRAGRRRVMLRAAPGTTFSALHYWSYAP